MIILGAGLPGVVLGAGVILKITASYAQFALGVLTLGLGLYSVFKPKLGMEHSPRSREGRALASGMVGLFVVGFLNGSITSGTGLFLTMWLIHHFGLDYKRAVAYTLVLCGLVWNGTGALVLGMLGVIASTALRQQAAYLVVVSIGSLLLAFGLGSTEALAAGLYYLPHTTFASAALFLLADAISRARGELADRFESGPAMPGARVMGGLFFVVAVALAGLPPLSGFLGKFMLLKAALDSPLLIWVWSIVLITGLLGVIALARSGSLLFYRTHSAHDPASLLRPTTGTLAPVAGLLLLVVGMTIWAGPVSDYAADTAAQLRAPQQYIEAVLGTKQ
jgi:formate hydrogenlyase subunit 3/multisubunit Na+/H+ antiporter MnhD subunit